MKSATEIFDYINKDILDNHFKMVYPEKFFDIGLGYSLCEQYSVFKNIDEYIIYVGQITYCNTDSISLLFFRINPKKPNETAYSIRHYIEYTKNCIFENNHLTINHEVETIQKSLLGFKKNFTKMEFNLVTDLKEKTKVYNLALKYRIKYK